MTKIEGVPIALDDLAAGHDAMNARDPRANAILVLIEVLKDQVAKLREQHDAARKAMNASPLAAVAE